MNISIMAIGGAGAGATLLVAAGKVGITWCSKEAERRRKARRFKTAQVADALGATHPTGAAVAAVLEELGTTLRHPPTIEWASSAALLRMACDIKALMGRLDAEVGAWSARQAELDMAASAAWQPPAWWRHKRRAAEVAQRVHGHPFQKLVHSVRSDMTAFAGLLKWFSGDILEAKARMLENGHPLQDEDWQIVRDAMAEVSLFSNTWAAFLRWYGSGVRLLETSVRSHAGGFDTARQCHDALFGLLRMCPPFLTGKNTQKECLDLLFSISDGFHESPTPSMWYRARANACDVVRRGAVARD